MDLFAAQLEQQLSQGDVFPHGWDADPQTPLGPVVVVSENCDIDKTDTVLVADLFRDQDTDASLLGDIRAGRVWRALHFTGQGYWTNLRTIRPIPKSRLQARLDRRLCSMTSMGRLALAAKVFAFLTYKLPPDSRYFRDEQGTIWDVWQVKRKVVGRMESTLRARIRQELQDGWLCFKAGAEHRRLAPVPFGWQHLPEAALHELATSAVNAQELADPIADAADALGPPPPPAVE
jgi:hypothetical protein